MEYVRVTIDPIGRVEHFVRPSAKHGRSLVACTQSAWQDSDRIRRKPVDGLKFRCPACQTAYDLFWQHLADVEASRCDLLEGYDNA